MAFPSSPSNGDLHTEFGRTFKYSSATNSWSVATPDAPADTLPSSQAYVDVASLPLSGVVAGSTAFVQDGNKLFMFSGNGWFEIATINTAPTITQGANASYGILPGGSPTVITLQATDPEGTPIVWGYQLISGSLQDTTITNVDNVFTITPGATNTSFNIVFTASDGVNTDTSAATFVVEIPWSFQGTQYGYSSGGRAVNTFKNTIDRFSFANNSDAVSVGTLSGDRHELSGHSSSEHGYAAGGQETSFVNVTTIDKFAFATNGGATDMGDVTTVRRLAAGHSNPVNGYVTAGADVSGFDLKSIDKFSFASNNNAINAGDLWQQRAGATPLSSPDYAYTCTGYYRPNNERFPYASESAAQTVGGIPNTEWRYNASGSQNSDYGYVSGGDSQAQNYTGSRLRFSFASNATSVNVGNMNRQRSNAAGQSSTEHGYMSGGYNGSDIANIERFSFASDSTSAYNRDLSSGNARRDLAGQQV